jgi:hypothetical protein
MTGPVWLVVFLGTGLVWVVLWMFIDWRQDVRQAKTAVRTAQAAIADMGRHSADESEERTEPTFVEARAVLPVGDEPPKRPRCIPVHELLARVHDEGHALRLNWRREDEQRARGGDGTWTAGDFPTAVLPVIHNEKP